MTSERERLLDELGLCFVRQALEELLADPNSTNESAAEDGQSQRRREGDNRGKHNEPSAQNAT